MSETIKAAMGKTDGDSGTVGFDPSAPWWAKLVGSQGTANVILLIMAAAIIPSAVTWIRSASTTTKAVGDAAIAQVEIQRHMEAEIANQSANAILHSTNLTKIVDLQAKVLDIQAQIDRKADKMIEKQAALDKMCSCLDRIVDRLDHPIPMPAPCGKPPLSDAPK